MRTQERERAASGKVAQRSGCSSARRKQPTDRLLKFLYATPELMRQTTRGRMARPVDASADNHCGCMRALA
jgi:hypothetical protein